jgi:hypothetical protein
VAAVPVDLAAAHGWGATQTLMVLAGLIALVLVLVPGIVSLLLGRRSR